MTRKNLVDFTKNSEKAHITKISNKISENVAIASTNSQENNENYKRYKNHK